MESLRMGAETVRRFSGEVFYNIDKAVRAMYDVMDNSPWYARPREYEASLKGDGGAKVRENFEGAFLPPGFGEKVFEKFSEEGYFAHHDVPGYKEEGTKHGHRFIVDASGDTRSFFFLDPEHLVGQRNVWRPSVCNILAMRISQQHINQPEFAFLRGRTIGVDREILDSFPELEHIAQELISTEGYSDKLISSPENLIFRVALTKEKAVVQSRYVGEKGISALAVGSRLPRFIMGKAFTQQIILQKFLEKPMKRIQRRR